MKRSALITLLVTLFAFNMLAQDSAPELVNAGNTAYAAKDYATALTNWEAYIKHPDATVEDVEAYSYKCASAAKKAGDIEKCRSYYEKCIALDFKADMCTYQLASTYKKTDEAKYISLIETCVNDYPKSKYYKKYFLPSVTKYYNKAASTVFNEANTAAQSATGSGDATVYVSKMETEVLPLFTKAEEAFNKTLSFDATDATATNAITNINTQRQAFEDYKVTLAAQKK